MARPLVHEAFEPFEKDQADLSVDIAVVGAGVSGAYSAWRLKQKYPGKRITLFEYSNRVGGRLYSTQLPGMPHVNAELGGMRYIPDSQAFVRELIENLGLPTRDFPMGAPDDPGGMNNLMYLRRRLMRARDLTNPAMVPYLMNPTEQGMNPDQLQAYVMNSLVPNAANLKTQDQWNEVKIFNGEPLYKTGFWNLLYRVLTSEAYQFMDDAGGYYTNVANSNSVLSLPVFEFGPNIRYKTLDAGYEELPRAIVKSFADEGGDVQMNLRLDSFEKHGDAFSMLFVRTATDARGCTDPKAIPGPKETLKVSAKQVILAMPRRSLELIRWEPLVSNNDVRAMVNSVISQAAFKIFLGYPYPWWRVLGLQAGRSITDMPLRQTFYFQTEGEQQNADPNNLNSLMMVSYNDLGSVPFWKALEAQTLGPDSVFHGRPNPFVPGGCAVPPTPFEITTQMVDTAQALVREIHNLEFVPEPYTAAYHDWSDDPYGAGWHAWKAGVEFWKVMPRIRKPVAEDDVFICGEAYSINQGWVEGALQTAELMLDQHFGMKPPSWLPSGYYLGY